MNYNLTGVYFPRNNLVY